MAVNTKQKRLTAINPGCPWRGLYKVPSGAISGALKQGIAFLYSGIAAAAAVIITFVKGGSDGYGSVVGFLYESRVGSHKRRKRIIYER